MIRNNYPDELLIKEIQNLLPDNKLVGRFTAAILAVIDGLKSTEHFCPYLCPTITALELVIRVEVDDEDYAWSLIRDLDDMRNDILELRDARAEKLYYKYGLWDLVEADKLAHPVYNAANTCGLSAERKAGKVVVADDTVVKILPGCDLTSREASEDKLYTLLQREAQIAWNQVVEKCH